MGTRGRSKGQPSDRPSWPDERGTDLTTLPSYWPEQMTEAVLAEAARPSWLESLAQQDEPLWERWFERALEEGVEESLARLGRALIRGSVARGWDEDRCAECGWLDEGEAMLELALLEADRAETRWRSLLEGE
jgi:hypothetical protein